MPEAGGRHILLIARSYVVAVLAVHRLGGVGDRCPDHIVVVVLMPAVLEKAGFPAIQTEPNRIGAEYREVRLPVQFGVYRLFIGDEVGKKSNKPKDVQHPQRPDGHPVFPELLPHDRPVALWGSLLLAEMISQFLFFAYANQHG